MLSLVEFYTITITNSLEFQSQNEYYHNFTGNSFKCFFIEKFFKRKIIVLAEFTSHKIKGDW